MKRFLRSIAVVLLGAALAAGGLAGWLLRTQAGRARLASGVTQRLESATGYGVQIRGLAGALPGRGRVAEVRVSDSRDAWLVVSNLSWQVTLLEGRRFAPSLHRLSAESVDWLRRPVVPRAARAGGGRGFVPLVVEAARVGEFRAHHAAAGVDLAVALEGAGSLTATGYAAKAVARAEGLTLHATLQGSGVVWQAAAEGRATNAPLLRAWAGGAVQAAGEVTLRARSDPAGLQVHATLAAGSVTTRWLNAGAVLGRVEAVRGTDGWRGTGAVELVEGSRSNLMIRRVRAEAGGSFTQFVVRVPEADLHVGGQRVALAEPLVLRGSPSAVSWSAPAVSVRDGILRAHGMWTPREVQAFAQLENGPLEGWLPARARLGGGYVSGALVVGGHPCDPWWTVTLNATGLHPRADQHLALAPADLTLLAVSTNRRLGVQADLRGWTDEPVQVRADLPLVAAGWWPRVDHDQPGSASLVGAFQLERLQTIADLRGATVKGELRGELAAGGTLASPDVHGRVTWRAGALDLPETATVLRDITVVLEGDRERLVVREATATDGAGGRIAGEGYLLFRPDQGFPLATALTLQRAELWRPGGSRVRLEGRLAVTGNVHDLVVTGLVRAVDVEYRLARRAPRIDSLAVEGLEAPASAPSRAPSQWRSHVRFDLRLTGREMMVAGRGLESQWRMDLQVSGLAAAPRVAGSVGVERGYFLFMGRRFALEQGGLTLDGRWPPEPVLGLQASSRAGDMTARMLVGGPISAPRLELESDPSYPVDEIVSRLLFGKSTDTISALQAVKLAHGLNVLRGKGGTLELLDRGQSLLRVDQLELQQDEESAELSSISVGKYIGRSVYVQGQKGLGGAEDVLSVEVELTPSLILQSETSPNIREGIGLQWRRDY